MKLWAITRNNNKIVLDKIFEKQTDEVEEVIYLACETFDIGKPLILTKNEKELRDFYRTVFYAADFMEPIDFDTFEIEIVDEERAKVK